MPEVGSKFTLNTDQGLGQSAVDDDLKGDMADLDMAPGTEVTVDAIDNDMVFLAWSDASGNPRRTSVPVADFSNQFTEGV